jgi:hypothetical protein
MEKYRLDDHVTRQNSDGSETEMWPTWSIFGSKESSCWFGAVNGGEVPAVMANDRDGWVVVDVEKRFVNKIGFAIDRANNRPVRAIVFGKVEVRKLKSAEERWDSERVLAHQETLELCPIE